MLAMEPKVSGSCFEQLNLSLKSKREFEWPAKGTSESCLVLRRRAFPVFMLVVSFCVDGSLRLFVALSPAPSLSRKIRKAVLMVSLLLEPNVPLTEVRPERPP